MKYPETTTKMAWDYAQAIVAGDIVSCKYLQKACKKLLNEYNIRQHEEDYPWFFHEPTATHLLKFISRCKYPDGLVAGQFIELHPWQNFVFAMAYGWRKKADQSIPRFTDIYTRIARKNDKTTGLSGVMAYELLTGPQGHEEYITAVDKNQASIAFKKATAIAESMDVKGNPIRQVYGTLRNDNTKAFLVARSRENKASDGASAYRAFFDEAARIEDEESFDIILSSQGAWQGRYQNWFISTAQANQETRYFRDMEVGRNLLDKLDETPDILDRKLYIFYELDDEKEWDDPSAWIKANPSMGLSVLEEDLAQECHDAKVSPSKKSEFLRKKCNIYVAAEHPWMDVDVWKDCGTDTIARTGDCFIGVDFGKTSDLNAVCLLWVNDNRYYEAEFKAFLPRDSLAKAPKHTINIYKRAIDNGTLILTDGDVIDHRVIKTYLQDVVSTYNVKEVAFDPYKSQQLITELGEEKMPLVQQRQGRVSLGPGISETERIIVSKQIKHVGDDFIAWQLANCQVDVDAHDLPILTKPSDSARKIDNIVALTMAITRATLHGGLNKQLPQITFI